MLTKTKFVSELPREIECLRAIVDISVLGVEMVILIKPSSFSVYFAQIKPMILFFKKFFITKTCSRLF